MVSLAPFASLAAVVLAPAALAQTQAVALPVPGSPTYLGVYHMDTGTWSDGPGPDGVGSPTLTSSSFPMAALGQRDVIYDNTASPTSFFDPTVVPGFTHGTRIHSFGGIPGVGNPTSFPVPPNRDQYQVNRIDVGYVDMTDTPVGSQFGTFVAQFRSGHGACTPVTDGHNFEFAAYGLPHGGAFTFSIELGDPSFYFCLEADGSPEAPQFDGVQALDTFSAALTYLPGGSGPAGVLLAGDPAFTDSSWTPGTAPTEGAGTYYGNSSSCGSGGTGYMAEDQLFLRDLAFPSGPPITTCVSLGGYLPGASCGAPPVRPYSSAYLRISGNPAPCELRRDQCTGSGLGIIYCVSNPNSTGVNATMKVCGHPMVEKDDLLLEASNVPVGSFGVFLVSETAGFGASPAGSSGNICVAGNIGRFVEPGQIKQAGPDGRISLDTLLGEWSLQSVPTAVGPYSATGGVPQHFQLWYRDAVAGQPTSNFSDAIQFFTR